MPFIDAIAMAHRSTIRRHRTGAVIYDVAGRVLATGWSHVPTEHYAETPYSMHAEHHALSRLAPKDRHRAHSITIATLTKANNLTSGDPCPACAAKLSATPIREVVATQKMVK